MHVVPQLRSAGFQLALADAVGGQQVVLSTSDPARPAAASSPHLLPSIRLPSMSLRRKDSPTPRDAPGRGESAELRPAACQVRSLPSSGTDTNLPPHGNSKFGRVPCSGASFSWSQLPAPQALPRSCRAEMQLPPASLPCTALCKGHFSRTDA